MSESFPHHLGEYDGIPDREFSHYRIMFLYSMKHAIKEKNNLKEHLRSDFDQVYHDDNELKLNLAVST